MGDKPEEALIVVFRLLRFEKPPQRKPETTMEKVMESLRMWAPCITARVKGE